MPQGKASRVWVIMGVCGCGKSTVGTGLAEKLGCEYIEADTYHSDANVAKMRSGQPLTDDDRWPWLDSLAARIKQSRERNEDLVVGCSALKVAYRHRLSGGELTYTSEASPIVFLWLKVSEEVLKRRMDARKDHFMPSSLIKSQFATLEVDQYIVPMDSERDGAEVVKEAFQFAQQLDERTVISSRL
mmetsp:Transcript_16820/g.20218  ORF Transcript_16820/g.20218 Transcript_16820/m.20218 type:complete len:187 (+) Transcript_16820:63-623(+)